MEDVTGEAGPTSGFSSYLNRDSGNFNLSLESDGGGAMGTGGSFFAAHERASLARPAPERRSLREVGEEVVIAHTPAVPLSLGRTTRDTQLPAWSSVDEVRHA